MNNPLMNDDIVRKIVSKYSCLLKMEVTYTSKALFGEYRLWSVKSDRKSNKEDSNQKTVIEHLSECGRDVFLVINMLLQVLAILPVSAATAERTFSTLKRV
ncbi:hypothetical protein PR048_008323 [Dryococelus australis]|uniref:HAT C-terminal dimerisation domain-containing protein n=1 Tax=Dryococelus australis TaxID=614101 RepID=A0ABQ9HWS0_9NEOP|nr:hypothetical protein PR048_008323 [Dryococelus australis]